MIIEKIQDDQRTKLRLSLLKFCQTRRGVSYVVTAESEFVGNIQLSVTGKIGTGTKNITVIFNQATAEWEAYCDGYVCKMLGLSEITNLIKTKITKLSTLMSKI